MKRFFITIVGYFLFLIPSLGRAEEYYFDSNGVKIRYIIEGQGEPVLLIHGFTVDVEKNWGTPGILKSLAKDYQVIALDNRGHGKSGKPHSQEQYGTEMVEDAIRLLDHLKINKAHVVGYSMGAAITLKLLVTRPERLLSATLGGSGGIRENDKQFLAFSEVLAQSLEQGKGMGPLIDVLTPAGRPKPTEEVVKQMNKLLLANNDAKALAEVIRGMSKFAVSDENLKANQVPTLALVGQLDPLKKGVDELNGRLTNLHVVVLNGADHMTAFFMPRFVKELREFLSKGRQKVKQDGKPQPGK